MARTVNEIKNPELFSLRPSDSAEEALSQLAALDISGAPVIGDDRRPVGAISFRDLIRRQGATVAECMSGPAVTISAESSVQEAAGKLAERGLHRLVVVDDTGRAIGVVSTLDVLRGMLNLGSTYAEVFSTS